MKLLLLLCFFFCYAAAIEVLDVHRLVQYDIKTDQYGSQLSEANFAAASYQHQNLLRKMVILPVTAATPELIASITTQSVGGILVTFPTNLTTLTPTQLLNWRNSEKYLLSNEFKFPVYFTYETEEMQSIINEILENADTGLFSASTSFQVVIPGPEAKKLKDVKATTIHGILRGRKDEQAAPSIAIVAHYDVFNAAPTLGGGSDSNGSGVASLLDIARIFSKLYSSDKTHGKYNILFALTGAGQLNFEGTKEWIASLDPTIAAGLEFVLCLDSLGSYEDEGLYLHVSRLPKEGNPFYDFQNIVIKTGEQRGVDAQIVHKKVNLSDPYIPWEHEQLSREKIVAGTLSSKSKASPSVFHSNILDKRVNVEKVQENLHVITESLFKYIYRLETQEIDLFGSKNAQEVQKAFLESWLSYLNSISRSVTEPNEKLVGALEKEIDRWCDEQAKRVFKIDFNGASFYEQQIKKMEIFKTKPPLFDMILSLIILVYVGAVYVFLVGIPTATANFYSLLGKKK